MRLADNGIDVFYIDESNDHNIYVVSAVTIPFIRKVDGVWSITWGDHHANARQWRRKLKDELKIPVAKELHGLKLASGRGAYFKGKYTFPRPKAGAVYRRILESLSVVVPEASIITVAARRGGKQLYGKTKLEAALYALLQRMRTQCSVRGTNGMVFFDQGHDEYRKLYRQAQVYLPTGSQTGGWEDGASAKNMPLDMFTKDGNEKNSKHCWFTQMADLVAYAAFLKLKGEYEELEDWQAANSLGNLFDSVPPAVRNLKASRAAPQDGIVRLK
jgi:hypothetical protein